MLKYCHVVIVVNNVSIRKTRSMNSSVMCVLYIQHSSLFHSSHCLLSSSLRLLTHSAINLLAMFKNHITCFTFFLLLLLLVLFVSNCVIATKNQEQDVSKLGPLVAKEKRHSIAQTDYGQISAVEISDGIKGPYQFQFITLEPNSLFLPVLLHADMVFYVQTGSGSFSWVDDGEKDQIDVKHGQKNQVDVKPGVIHRIRAGSIFFIKSGLEFERQKLRICAIFTTPTNIEYSRQLYSEPYITVSDLITGFDRKVLQAAFQVSEEVIDNITRTSKPPPIVHAPSTNETEQSVWTMRIFEALTGVGSYEFENKKTKKTKTSKTFNILEKKPDFENCNGWSKTVNRKDLKALKGSDMGVFMVNLTQGSMMGPHWNPRASEMAVVLHGQGMVRVVCSSMGSVPDCKNMRFRVKEGDVFAVPRFHPMAQMAFNNDTFVFMGFSTMASQNYPQFLTGKSSVLQTLDRDILAMSFNVPNATIDQLLSSQADSIILECLSCAEEEEKRMEEETESGGQEEAKKREEEEAARKQEEDQRKQEEAARKQEEDQRKQEEAARKQEEDRRKQEEEAARRQQEQEEAARRQQEEAARRQQEQQEEAARRQQEQQEEAARRQQEEAARRQQEQEEAARRQQEQEEAGRRQEGQGEKEWGWEGQEGSPEPREGWEGGGGPRKVYNY